MKKGTFWNDAARDGALLGILLGVSTLAEITMQLSGRMGLMALFCLEFFAVVALHYWLLHRFTRRHSALFTAEEGFTFGQGYGYLVAVSAFAGVIVGAVQALYIHAVLGYSTYLERYVASLMKMTSELGSSASSMTGYLRPMLEQIERAPAPSVFATFMGGIWTSLLFGALFGLIIAGVLSRAPRLFDKEQE